MTEARTDYLILGSGIAGMFTALVASEFGKVTLATKSKLIESNTRYAQGGIAAATSEEDTPESHYEDTLQAGAGLCDVESVVALTKEATARILDLTKYGVAFDQENGEFARGLEGAHSRARVLHAGGDRTGAAIASALSQAIRRSSVRVVEDAFATELVKEDETCAGANLLLGGRIQRLGAKHTVLATGGAGQLFRFTTNPPVATGDGLALAFRIGAPLEDLEFFQFHPTALQAPGVPTFLISEAVRGEGGILRNLAGERFMGRYDTRLELASRDIVSRAILSEMAREGASHVWLDVRHFDSTDFAHRFPTIDAFCRAQGIELPHSLIPVAPAAHYMMGGIKTDSWGRTGVPGLYACGETACTGVHGANRLASNSLLEGVVFARRVVEASVRGEAAAVQENDELHVEVDLENAAGHTQPRVAELQSLMWENVGIRRSGPGLSEALEKFLSWSGWTPSSTSQAEHELANRVLVGRLMAQAALAREESRGSHYRTDFPIQDAAWRRRIVVENATAPVCIPALGHA